MMLLGIVVQGAVSLTRGRHGAGWPFDDPAQTILAWAILAAWRRLPRGLPETA